MVFNRFRSRVLALLVLLFISVAPSMAQGGKKLPPFRVMQPNGKIFRAQDLPFEKPIILIYFSPDCDDCLKFIDELFKEFDSFKGASIAMISFLSVDEISRFSNDYKIGNYKNIYLGTEGSTYFLKNYYRLQEMPFAAIYDKNGNLKSTFIKPISVKDMVSTLKKL